MFENHDLRIDISMNTYYNSSYGEKTQMADRYSAMKFSIGI